jgi:hypothetical protein
MEYMVASSAPTAWSVIPGQIQIRGEQRLRGPNRRLS